MNLGGHGAKIARTLCVGLALVHFGALLWVFAHRIAYPYDLEWMEGGMLCHSLRLLEGKPIYDQPSVEFIPYLYTPLYPALVALAAKLFGLRYSVARAISILSFAGATALGYRFAADKGHSRAAALVAMAIPWAAWPLTGTFYDLARADSLWLLLTTAGLLALYWGARDEVGAPRRFRELRGHALVSLSAGLLVAAFFTKQIAAPMMVAGGLALVVLNYKLVPTFGGVLALVGLPSLYLENRATGGWFWRYIFELHQGHDFLARRAFVETPLALALIVGPAILLVPWALVRRRSPSLLYAAWLALAGVGTAALASGTQWAVTNAYIPGVFFPSLAIALAAARLLPTPRWVARAEGRKQAPRIRAVFIYGAIALSLALKLPSLDGHRDDAFNFLGQARLVHRFDLRRFLPTRTDRQAGDALVDRLRAAPGEVMIPFHPFYGHLAGKRTWVHQIGVMDVVRAGLGMPLGLGDAIRGRHFALIVLDDKIEGKWTYWPGLQDFYELSDHVAGPRVYSGAMTVPDRALVPRGSLERREP